MDPNRLVLPHHHLRCRRRMIGFFQWQTNDGTYYSSFFLPVSTSSWKLEQLTPHNIALWKSSIWLTLGLQTIAIVLSLLVGEHQRDTSLFVARCLPRRNNLHPEKRTSDQDPLSKLNNQKIYRSSKACSMCLYACMLWILIHTYVDIIHCQAHRRRPNFCRRTTRLEIEPREDRVRILHQSKINIIFNPYETFTLPHQLSANAWLSTRHRAGEWSHDRNPKEARQKTRRH